MPSTGGYLVSPRSIALIAAYLMLSGVSKSGSPTESDITSRPLALRSRAFCVIAMVADGLTRERTSARKAMGGLASFGCSMKVERRTYREADAARQPQAYGSERARLPDHGEKGWAVFCQFDRADAMNARQLVEAAGPALRHFDERPIGENHIGRLLLRRRDRAAQGLERSEELRVRIARCARFRGAAPTRFPVHHVLSQGERGLAAQHPPALFREDQPVAVVFVAADQAARLQLPEHAAPLGGRAILACAEGLEPLVAVLEDRLGRLAGQNIRQMAKEESARGAQNGRHRLLRLDPPVDQPNRALADVAMPAWAGVLAEHGEKRLAAAARRFAKRDEIVELGRLDALALLGRSAVENL